MACTWATVVTLGRVRIRPCGQLARCGQAGDEQVQRAQAAGPGGRLEALEADADERGRCAGRDCGGHGGSRSNSGGVLGVVAPVPEPVLEVQAQVLDRFAFQLRLDPGGHGLGEFGVLAQQVAQAGEPAVGVRRRQRLGAPLSGERRRETVRGYIHGMYGLAGAVVARVVALQQLVGGGQLGVDLGEIVRAEGTVRVPPCLSPPVRRPEW